MRRVTGASPHAASHSPPSELGRFWAASANSISPLAGAGAARSTPQSIAATAPSPHALSTSIKSVAAHTAALSPASSAGVPSVFSDDSRSVRVRAVVPVRRMSPSAVHAALLQTNKWNRLAEHEDADEGVTAERINQDGTGRGTLAPHVTALSVRAYTPTGTQTDDHTGTGCRRHAFSVAAR